MLEIILTPVLFLWIGFMIFLERKFPFRTGLPFFREGFWIDLVWYTIIQSYFLKILIFDFIILPIQYNYFSDITSQFSFSVFPLWAQVLFFLITHDFYIYWFHRLQHHNKWLWRTHEAHHSVKQVDWLAGSRSHVFEILINQTIEFAPIIILGASPEIVPIKAFLDAVFGLWIHGNVNIKLGWLGKIINTPVAHQWHHADDKVVYYSNYATKFSFWDYLFGTALVPNYKPTQWGLPYAFPKDYFMQHFFAIKRFDERRLFKKSKIRKFYLFRFKAIKRLPSKLVHLLLPKSPSHLTLPI